MVCIKRNTAWPLICQLRTRHSLAANLQFAAALIATLDARDRYTAGHSAAVAIYSRDIAERMGLAVEVQEHAYLCGLVHDIGKIGLPPGLLEKPGALTLEERRQMQEHSAIGERILAHVDEYSEIATVVRFHHERIDGQGYPDGLSGETHPTRVTHHRGRRRVQRDDLRSTISRRDAKSRCATAPGSSRRQPIRHMQLSRPSRPFSLEPTRSTASRSDCDFLEFAQSTHESDSTSSRLPKSPDRRAQGLLELQAPFVIAHRSCHRCDEREPSPSPR